jgi:hypothetical protein
MGRANLTLRGAFTVIALVAFLTLSVHAHAGSVVYDSLSNYTPDVDYGWLNGDVEQGFLISRSRVDRQLIKAEFCLLNLFLVPLNTTATIRFYSDQNGVPNDLLATVEGSLAVGARSVEEVSVDLPSILIPHDPVWVTWIFGSTSNAGGVPYYATPTIGSASVTRALWQNGRWNLDDFALRRGGPPLRLTAVPEPPSAALGCCALALLVAGRGIPSLPTRLGGG